MGKTYIKPMPDDEVFPLLRQARESWHDQLDRHKVTIGVTYVTDGSGQPCLRRRGNIFAAATIQITSLQHRMHGLPDAMLTIDAVSWVDRETDERLALLDHELHHLIVEDAGDSACKLDDAKRPVLRLRHHDFEIGGFYGIMDRHGRYAIERRNLESVLDRDRQLSLAFDSPSEVKRIIGEKMREVRDRLDAERRGPTEGSEPPAEAGSGEGEAPPDPGAFAVSGPPESLVERQMWALGAAAELIGRDCETLGFLKGEIDRPTFDAIHAGLKRLEAEPEAPPSWEFWSEFPVMVEALKGMAIAVWNPASGNLTCSIPGHLGYAWAGEMRREGEELRAFAERVVNELAGAPAEPEGAASEPPAPEDPPGQPPGLVGASGVLTNLDVFRAKTIAEARDYFGPDSLTVDALSGPRGTWEALKACAAVMAAPEEAPVLHWDRWCEFSIEIPGIEPPLCLYDPACGEWGQLEIHGPINADGVLVLHGEDLHTSVVLVDFATNRASAALKEFKAGQDRARKSQSKGKKKGNAA